MEGQKTYNLAMAIHQKMYARPHSAEEQEELHAQYFKLIKQAAYRGHIEGQYDLAQLYEDIGYLGIPNPIGNPKMCIYWYTKACQRGHAEACNNLATFYESGKGCNQNLDVALDLYKRSANFGSPNGKKNYKIMLRDMSKGGKHNK
jgi:hypothetical protein